VSPAGLPPTLAACKAIDALAKPKATNPIRNTVRERKINLEVLRDHPIAINGIALHNKRAERKMSIEIIFLLNLAQMPNGVAEDAAVRY
jgi:hypothetical protein